MTIALFLSPFLSLSLNIYLGINIVLYFFLFSCVIWFVLYKIYCSIVSEENIKVYVTRVVSQMNSASHYTARNKNRRRNDAKLEE